MKYENKTLKELESLLRGAELMTDTKSIEEIKWYMWLLKNDNNFTDNSNVVLENDKQLNK